MMTFGESAIAAFEVGSVEGKWVGRLLVGALVLIGLAIAVVSARAFPKQHDNIGFGLLGMGILGLVGTAFMAQLGEAFQRQHGAWMLFSLGASFTLLAAGGIIVKGWIRER